MARESKAELTDRLRREGRFEAFKARREELKRQGTPAGEAWGIAAAEFPTRAVETIPDGVATQQPLSDTDKAALREKRPVPMLAAIEWVFDSVDLDVTPADAPSAGAWALYQWVQTSRANRGEFYRVLMPKLLPTRSAPGGKQRGHENHGPGSANANSRRIAALLGELQQGV